LPLATTETYGCPEIIMDESLKFTSSSLNEPIEASTTKSREAFKREGTVRRSVVIKRDCVIK